MASQRETTARTPLLNKKGLLLRSSWAAEDLFIYNKETTNSRRVKEWEYYTVCDERFVFRLVYGHSRLLGLARAELYDRRKGERYVMGPERLLPGDAFDLDFSAEDPHHLRLEEKSLFLSLDYDGVYRRLRCRAGAFDVELMLPQGTCSLSTATRFKGKRQFYCCFRRLFPELRGQVTLNGKMHLLSEGAFACVESCRGILPHKLSRVRGVGCGVVDGHSVALLLGWGFGYATAGTENALFLDGELYKLNRVREKRRGEGFMGESRFTTGDGGMELIYTPREDQSAERRRPPVQMELHRTAGTIGGEMRLSDGTEITLQELPFLCDHERYTW